MRILLAAGMLLSSLAASPLSAATLIPVVPVPGAADTQATAINDRDAITGVYFDGGHIAHGFVGTLDGSYETFDSRTANTVTYGIDGAGDVVGESYATVNDCDHLTAFVRSADGKLKQVKKDGLPIRGGALGIRSKGVFVGFYCDDGNKLVAFRGKKAKYVEDVVLSGSHLMTAATGINAAGTIVGITIETDGHARGFVLQDGTTTIVADPLGTDTQITGVNDKGIATGIVTIGGQWHAVLYDIAKAAFTSIEPKGATTSVASGINDDGLTALYSDIGSFIYCPRKAAKCPKSGTAFTPPPARHGIVSRSRGPGTTATPAMPKLPFLSWGR